MIFYLIMAILIAVLMLLSLIYCMKEFDKLELIGLFIFCSSMYQQFFYFFASSFKFVDLVETHIPLWTIRMDYIVISPTLLVWTLYFFRRNKALWIKLIYSVLWIALSIALQIYEIYLGLLIDNNWMLYHEIIKRIVLLLICCSFMRIWNNALKRDKVIA